MVLVVVVVAAADGGLSHVTANLGGKSPRESLVHNLNN